LAPVTGDFNIKVNFLVRAFLADDIFLREEQYVSRNEDFQVLYLLRMHPSDLMKESVLESLGQGVKSPYYTVEMGHPTSITKPIP
jgi:hypothetical protein